MIKFIVQGFTAIQVLPLSFHLMNFQPDHNGIGKPPEVSGSDERLRLTLRAANVGVWDWDLRTNAVYFSPEWKRQIGYEEHELPNEFTEWQSRVHPQDRERQRQAVQAYLANPAGGYSVEFRFRHKDGSYRWILAQGSLLNDDQGKPARLLGSHLDITERKDAETRLISSEVQYRRLFEAARDGILILNAETGMIDDVNPYLTQLLGLTREELLQRKVWELGFFKHLVANLEKFEELKRNEYVRYDDLPLETADGRKVDVEFVSNVYEVNGVKVIQCNIRNITERKRAEEALRSSEEKYKGLFEMTRDAIMTLEPPDWRFTSGNAGAVKLFGAKDEAEFIAHGPADASPERQPDGCSSAEKAAQMIEAAMRDGSNFFEWTHQRFDGGEFPADVLLTRVELGDGMRMLHATVRDITERKRAAEVLQRRVTELERFHRLSVGRELQMVRLKQETNDLARLAGRTPPYDLAFLGEKMGHQTEP